MTREEIAASQPDWNLFSDGAPNGESPGQIRARVDRLIGPLRTTTGDVAIFSHGHLLRALAARWIGLAVHEGMHFSLDTAALGILGHDPHHSGNAVIAAWNTTKPTTDPSPMRDPKTARAADGNAETYRHERINRPS